MLWIPTLKKLFNILLAAQDSKSYQEYDIDFIFNDYKIETLEEKTTTASAGIAGRSWSIKTR